MKNTTKLLVEAIKTKRNVSFTYDEYVRRCSPHALGNKGEKENVLVYQFGGDSSKGAVTIDGPGNWRCMDVSKITDLEFIDGEWHTWSNHTVPSTCIDEMIIEVEY